MAVLVKGKSRPARDRIELVDPFAVLDQTHREVLTQLQALQGLMPRLEGYKVDDAARAIARGAVDFFGQHARQHHAEEEKRVFPDLLASGDEALRQQVLRLQQDHGWLEEDWLELGPMLAEIADGQVGVELESLGHALEVFGTLYHEHISLEESFIYPEARRRAAAAQAAREGRLATGG
jgi:hemerythrin-like domain-containing protein